MVNTELLTALESSLSPATRERVHRAIERIVEVKEKGGKIVVVTGSGPNIHEGVTTLLAELIRKGVVDGIITSSAVISHELAGSLDEVKRFDGTKLGLDAKHLPRGNIFEITIMDDDELKALSREMDIDFELYERPGHRGHHYQGCGQHGLSHGAEK